MFSWCASDNSSAKSTVTVSPAATVTIWRSAVRCSRWARTSYSPGGKPPTSNAPRSSVSANLPAPITRIVAPWTGSPPSTSVTAPRTAPVSCARAGVAAPGNRKVTTTIAAAAFPILLTDSRCMIPLSNVGAAMRPARVERRRAGDQHTGCRCTTDGGNVTGIRRAGRGREGERNGRARSSRRGAPARTPPDARPGRPRSHLRCQRRADIRNGRRRSPARRRAPRASRPRRTQRRSARSPGRRSLRASRNGSGQPRREQDLLPPSRSGTIAEACASRQRIATNGLSRMRSLLPLHVSGCSLRCSSRASAAHRWPDGFQCRSCAQCASSILWPLRMM